MTILDKIITNTKNEVQQRKARLPYLELRHLAESSPNTRPSFFEALKTNTINIIAEVKKASPSRGLICEDFDPVKIATEYERGGAAAISVLTDERFFQGHLNFLDSIAEHVQIPLLRKDFIIDVYQIYEAKLHDASAILLLANSLEQTQLQEFLDLAHALGLDALVEVHSFAELEHVLPVSPRIVGVNNRDLTTFHVDVSTSLDVIKHIPKEVVKVSESGIFSTSDIQPLLSAGYNAFLIGESLMKQQHRVQALEQLRGKNVH